MKREKNHLIELMRFLVAVIIMMHHFFKLNYGGAEFAFKHGNAGVEFFFLLSGILMAAHAKKVYSNNGNASSSLTAGVIASETISFIKNKISRIIIPFYLTWLASFAITVVIKHYGLMKIGKELINSIFELFFLRNLGFDSTWMVGQLWYVSAMFLVILVCYPLLLKFKECYSQIVALVISVVIMGWLAHEYGSLVDTSAWIGITYKSTFRAFAVMNLGVFAENISAYIVNKKWTKSGAVLLTIVELVSYVISLGYMCASRMDNHDFLSVIYLTIALSISFSGKSNLVGIFRNGAKVWDYLGKSSLYIYICHLFIARKCIPYVMGRMSSQWMVIACYIIAVAISSYILMLMDGLVGTKLLPWIKSKIWENN